MNLPGTVNNCLAAPTLAIHGAASALVKITNTIKVKANGVIASITAADAPSLAKATLVGPYSNTGAGGTRTITSNQIVGAPVVGSLAAGSEQVFTLCANVAADPNNTASPTVTLFWMAGASFVNTRSPQASDFVSPDDPFDVVVGWVTINNGTASAFVPGTTALDTASLTVTYTDNYAQVGN